MKNLDNGLLASKKDYLKQVSLFKGLTDAQLDHMISMMTAVEFDANTYVMHEDDSGCEIYILLDGEIEISKTLILPQWIQTAQTQDKALIKLSQKHHPFFGEMSMFGQESTREASIKATRPSKMAILQKAELLNAIRNDPNIGTIIYRNIAAELVKRLRKANKDILKLTTAFTLALEG